MFTSHRPCNKPLKVKFFESLVNSLNLTTYSTLEMNPDELLVSCLLADNILQVIPNHLAEKCVLKGKSYVSVPLGRPFTCPLKGLGSFKALELSNSAPIELLERGVTVASCVLLESSDHKILITKRMGSLKSFPNVWVPPGGVVEPGESLERAAVREMYEETGLSARDGTLFGRPRMLGLFESCFPLEFKFSSELRTHHLVAYFTIRSNKTAHDLNQQLSLSECEVSKAVWLCKSVVNQAVPLESKTSTKSKLYLDELECPEDCECRTGYALGAVLSDDGTSTVPKSLEVKYILEKYERRYPNKERISTGTLYAMKLWLDILWSKKNLREAARNSTIGEDY